MGDLAHPHPRPDPPLAPTPPGRHGHHPLRREHRLAPNYGVPCYFATRPAAKVLQVSSGKGLTHDAARVSALMEAVELHHAEQDPPVVARQSTAAMAASPTNHCPPHQLEGFVPQWFNQHRPMAWIQAVNLVDQQPLLVPAGSTYFGEPTCFRTNTNGLASGNHLDEATLHGLCELLERDAVAGLEHRGVLQIRERARVLDPHSLPHQPLGEVVQNMERQNMTLVLLALPARIPVPDFWAVLLNRTGINPLSRLNAGYGCHPAPAVALSRAVIEAVQSRLTMIQGSREDIVAKPVFRGSNANEVFDFFHGLQPQITWSQLIKEAPQPPVDLAQVVQHLVGELADKGLDTIARVDLTRPRFQIPVVKISAPGLSNLPSLF